MAFVRTAARQMGHGLERVDVSLSMRKWWKLGYTRQNGLVRKNLSNMRRHVGWGSERNGGKIVASSLLFLFRIAIRGGGGQVGKCGGIGGVFAIWNVAFQYEHADP